MTTAELIAALQSLLDEQGIAADQGFYGFADLGVALDNTQQNMLNAAVIKLKENRKKGLMLVPYLLTLLIDEVSTGISEGFKSATLPTDFWAETHVEYTPDSTRDTQQVKLRNENGILLTRSKFSQPTDYDNTYSIDAGELVFGTVVQTGKTGTYKLVYVKTPVSMVTTDPSLPVVAHQTLLQGALAYVLRKGQEKEQEAIAAKETYNRMLGGMLTL